MTKWKEFNETNTKIIIIEFISDLNANNWGKKCLKILSSGLDDNCIKELEQKYT